MKRFTRLALVAALVLLAPLGTRTDAAMPVPELSPAGVPGPEIDVLVGLYRTARNRLKSIVRSPTGRTQTSRDFKQARAAQQISQVDQILREVAGDRGAWIGRNVPRAYTDGIVRGDQQAREAGVSPDDLAAVQGSFSQVDRDAVQAFARDIATDLATAERGMADQAARVLRITAQQDLAESDLDKILAGGLIEGKPAATIRELRDALTAVNGGITTIINRHGNPMQFETGYYARLVAVTKTRQATVVGRHNRLSRLGIDLVSIVGALSGNFCTAYMGKAYSLSGNDPKYPPLASLPSGGPPFHPQCSKSTRPFIPDLATDEQLANAEGLPDADHLANVDATTAQRRYKDLQLEQQVRAAYGSSPSLGDFTTKAPTPTPKPPGPSTPPAADLAPAATASPVPAAPRAAPPAPPPTDVKDRVRQGLDRLGQVADEDEGWVHLPFPPAPGVAEDKLWRGLPPGKLNDLTEEEVAAAPVVRVPKDRLIATQASVWAAKVVELAGKDAGESLVVRLGGRLYIADGHHRATAEVLAGGDAVRAKLFDYDPKAGTFKAAATLDAPSPPKAAKAPKPPTPAAATARPDAPVIRRRPAPDAATWLAGLKPDVLSAVKNWTGSEFKNLRLLERGLLEDESRAKAAKAGLGQDYVDERMKRYRQMQKRLFKGLETAPAYAGVVHRGLNNLREDEVQRFLAGENNSGVVEVEALSSTSRKADEVRAFASQRTDAGRHAVVLRAKVRSGIDLSAASTAAHEDEVVLARGTRLRIVNVAQEQVKNYRGDLVTQYTVDLEEEHG